MRPKYTDHFAALRALFLLAGFAFVGKGSLPLAQELALMIPFALICLTIFWFFRCGRNWARVLTIGYSLSAVSGLVYLPNVTLAQQLWYVSDALFSTVFVFWLFRPHVRAYFKPQPATASGH